MVCLGRNSRTRDSGLVNGTDRTRGNQARFVFELNFSINLVLDDREEW